MPNESVTKCFSVLCNVVAEPLSDNQPNGVGSEDERVMFAECSMDRIDQWVSAASKVFLSPRAHTFRNGMDSGVDTDFSACERMRIFRAKLRLRLSARVSLQIVWVARK